MSKTTLYQDDTFHLELELLNTIPLFHSKSETWNKTEKIKQQDVFEGALEALQEVGYTEVYTLVPEPDDKNKKYVALFGFEYSETLPLESERGVEEVWVRRI